MAPVNRLDAMRASLASVPHREPEPDSFEMNDFEAELKRLSAVNQELLEEFHHESGEAIDASPDMDELTMLRQENAELKALIKEMDALSSSDGEEAWLERQREYEMLLEEKSQVIRDLHQKMQESEESVIGGASSPPSGVGMSGTRLGQAEEILRLKRELEEQRRQLEQDEADMMNQMRMMEMAMAKERAEMARQRQEVQRIQADLARELENSTRNPELRERLQSLRRNQPDSTKTPAPIPIPAAAIPKQVTPPSDQKQSSGFLRRIFG